MEYQIIINLLDNTHNEEPKFWTRKWFEINNESGGTYNTSSQTKFKTSVVRPNLWNYSNVYILVSGTIKITGAGADDPMKRTDEGNKGVIFKNSAPFADCISEMNNTQIDNAKYIHIVMPMYNLIKCCANYSKTSGSLWQY